MAVKIIAHPTTGELFTQTSNSKWYKCQIESKELSMSNGFINLSKRSAFPLIPKEAVEMLQEMGLKSGDNFPIQGKITRKITSAPQFEGHQPVSNPKTGEIMNYYQSFTFTENVNETDVDERVAVETKVSKAIPTNAVFDEE